MKGKVIFNFERVKLSQLINIIILQRGLPNKDEPSETTVQNLIIPYIYGFFQQLSGFFLCKII